MCAEYYSYAEFAFQRNLKIIEIYRTISRFHCQLHASPKMKYFYGSVEILSHFT